ncbi:hypothetical protein DMN77_15950 [Paenibacillus sp. 79R4]|nr:hypothetical protein [Paenibacillus sp. 79R4]
MRPKAEERRRAQQVTPLNAKGNATERSRTPENAAEHQKRQHNAAERSRTLPSVAERQRLLTDCRR